MPHRAADLYPEIKEAVWRALRDGAPVPHAVLRDAYRDRLSHGTYYRYVNKAVEAFQAEK